MPPISKAAYFHQTIIKMHGNELSANEIITLWMDANNKAILQKIIQKQSYYLCTLEISLFKSLFNQTQLVFYMPLSFKHFILSTMKKMCRLVSNHRKLLARLGKSWITSEQEKEKVTGPPSCFTLQSPTSPLPGHLLPVLSNFLTSSLREKVLAVGTGSGQPLAPSHGWLARLTLFFDTFTRNHLIPSDISWRRRKWNKTRERFIRV